MRTNFVRIVPPVRSCRPRHAQIDVHPCAVLNHVTLLISRVWVKWRLSFGKGRGDAVLRLLALFPGGKKSGPISRAALKEAREGGKVREGNAYGSAKQNLHGVVEKVRRELKSFPVERPLLLLPYVALTTPNRELIDGERRPTKSLLRLKLGGFCVNGQLSSGLLHDNMLQSGSTPKQGFAHLKADSALPLISAY